MSLNLDNIDVAVLIDTSGTMGEKDGKSMTRLELARESCIALARELESHDPDGITVTRFAGKVRIYDGVTAEKVKTVFTEFRPMGGTNTKEAISQTVDKLWDKNHGSGAAGKSICLVIFTDGEPDDKVGVAQAIVDITKKMSDDSQVGILFVQVGPDASAAAYLEKLNNNLTAAGAAFDIVAVTKLEDLEDLAPAEILEMAFND